MRKPMKRRGGKNPEKNRRLRKKEDRHSKKTGSTFLKISLLGLTYEYNVKG